MKNKLLLLLILLAFIPLNVHASGSSIVNNENDLKDALKDPDIDIITLGKDIDTHEKINITRPVTIDGNNNTIRYIGTFGSNQSNENTVWGGIYVLQVYKTTATIKNIKLTGGNAALLVNGSKVTLIGNIDVSGNGFGGIELGQGVGIDELNSLNIDDATIINTTESANKPTLWVPSDSDNALLIKDGKKQTITSGDELILKEINALFKETLNPATTDNINIVIISLILSLFTLKISLKYLKKES